MTEPMTMMMMTMMEETMTGHKFEGTVLLAMIMDDYDADAED